MCYKLHDPLLLTLPNFPMNINPPPHTLFQIKEVATTPMDPELLRHEFTHVLQYERVSIAAFLGTILNEVVVEMAVGKRGLIQAVRRVFWLSAFERQAYLLELEHDKVERILADLPI